MTDKQKIDQFLLSNKAENTLLAYQLLQSQLGYGAKRALKYVINYFFKVHKATCENKLIIAFDNILEISFNIFEISDWAYVDIESFLDYRVYDNTKILKSGNYDISRKIGSNGDLSSYKDKAKLKEIIDDFCLNYESLIIAKLGG